MRRDQHSPSRFDPADYRYEWMIDLNPTNGGLEADSEYLKFAREAVNRFLESPRPSEPHRGLGQCEHCGAHFLYGAVFRHIPTGQVIQVGNVCADEAFGHSDRRSYDLKRAKERASAARATATRKRKVGEFLIANSGLTETFEVFGDRHHILSDMRARLARSGKLTPKQVAFAFRLRDQIAAELLTTGPACDHCGGDHQIEECPNRTPAPIGKKVVTGVRIVHTRLQDGYYGSAWKGLFVSQDGWKAWGTVPAAWFDIEGDRHAATFSLRAGFKQSEEDRYFAFLNRPSIVKGTVQAVPFQTVPESTWDQVPESAGGDDSWGDAPRHGFDY